MKNNPRGGWARLLAACIESLNFNARNGRGHDSSRTTGDALCAPLWAACSVPPSRAHHMIFGDALISLPSLNRDEIVGKTRNYVCTTAVVAKALE